MNREYVVVYLHSNFDPARRGAYRTLKNRFYILPPKFVLSVCYCFHEAVLVNHKQNMADTSPFDLLVVAFVAALFRLQIPTKFEKDVRGASHRMAQVCGVVFLYVCRQELILGQDRVGGPGPRL